MLAEPGIPWSAEAVDIGALVRDTVKSEQLISSAKISLQQPDQGPRYLMAVGTRLRRALANVLANATQAAGPDGHVEVTEQAQGSMELVEIADDGPGFGSMTVGTRTGIGLQITGQMLAECGGRMEVERLSSGQTLVRLLMPVMADGRMAGDGR